MPVFEYKCDACGKVFDEYVKKSDDEVFCPACKARARKNLSGKMWTATGKTCGGNCTGDCKTCGGCK